MDLGALTFATGVIGEEIEVLRVYLSEELRTPRSSCAHRNCGEGARYGS